MFEQQKLILESIDDLQGILSNYSWKAAPENWLEIAGQESRRFIVTLPFVGAFSAGKSTLINTLFGESLLKINIDPETAYPAEISYGATEKMVGHLPDGKEIPLTRDDLHDNLTALLPKGSYVSIALPHPLLAKLPHLRLVDMPGWDSGIEAHTNAIDNYAARSLAYCVVVSADEGNLRESLRRALRELAVGQMPILAVISKADKKPPEDVDAVVEQVREEITATMGRPPLAVVKASRKAPGELVVELERLEQQTEELFANGVTRGVIAKLGSFNAHLDTLINSDDLDSEKIQAECDRLNDEMAGFEARRDDETRQLEIRVQPVLNRIMERVRTALREDIESMTCEAIDGGDLGGSIGCTVRLAVQEGFDADFNPEIERYLGRVNESLPDGFLPEINGSFGDLRAGAGSEQSQPLVLTPILAVLTPLLKFVPQLAVISTVILGVVAGLEKLFGSRKQQELEEARQREAVRRKIAGEIIPDAIQQVRDKLQPMLEQHIQSARQKIASTVQAQRISHEAALRQLQAKLAEGQAAFSAARTGYQADRDTVNHLIARLEQA